MAGILSILAGAIGSTPPPAFTGGNMLYAWGSNNYGQLGLGDSTYRSNPNQVGTLTDWNNITGGWECSFSVKTDGTLWAWGANAAGGLGLGNTTNYSSPKQVGALTNWKTVYAGGSAGQGSSAFAIKTDGTLWSWGSNLVGKLGLGNTTNYSSPKQVGALTDWSEVSVSNAFVGALKTNGTLWTWGNNSVGQLGLGNTTNYSSPKQVGALTDWKTVVCGSTCMWALKTNGRLWTWGNNSIGELGLGNTTNYSSPKQVGALTDWSKVSGNGWSVSAIKTNGTLWSWGSGSSGTLGLGNTTQYNSPKQVGALADWSIISRSENHSMAIKTNGTLWAWGYNGAGGLGVGNTTNYSSPKQVGVLTNWLSVSANGGYFTTALTKPPATVPDKPSNVQATAGNSSATVTFTAPANGGSTITGYTVKVYAAGVYTGISTSGATNSITVTGLTNGTAYTFKVAATNAIGTGLESNASTAITPTNLTVGGSYAGGYYAGQIVDGGVTYKLVVAPKASGANGGSAIPWKTSSTAAPVATQTLTNGVAASNAMNSSTYPAAFYCNGLNIGGFTDWYLPARDELEVLYRNLKPGTTANHVEANRRTAAILGTGFGTDGGANGYNANSSPVGAAYTSGSPAQSGIAVFKTGGTEGFLEGDYWSSTEFNTGGAWDHSFYDGLQDSANKGGNGFVRAIRRVL